MRIFKGLENIHAVIDRHEIEWRKEQGEPVEEQPSSFSPEERIRRQLTKSAAETSGRFSPDRFLGGSSKKKTAPENNAEVIEIIKQKDGKPHSWLYNEVVKAINDAAGNDKNTKVIAVFIPVVQNGKEFEDLPVSSSVTLPPVNEEDFNVAEILEENTEAEEVENENAPENLEPEIETEAPVEVAEVEEAQEISSEIEQEPEQESLTQEQEPEIEENEEGQELELSNSEEDFNLLPESQETPDEELAEAFNVMEEKLDEALLEEEQAAYEENEENQEPSEQDTELDIENHDAETMSFDEFPVIKEETEAEVEVEEVLEEITPETELEQPELIEETLGEFSTESEELPEQEPEPETETESYEEVEENKFPDAPQETENEIEESVPPIEDFDDEEVFEEPLEAIRKLSENTDDEIYDENEEEEIIRLDNVE